MKRILILLLGMSLFSCNLNNNSNSEKTNEKVETVTKIENFDWLLGEWKRNNDDPGKETFENWKKISDSEYIGIGFTMQNGDTISQEKIKLIKREAKWNLMVKMPEDTEPTTFEMTEYKNDAFTCENDTHDFPKQIKYWKNGEKINALVAGDEFEISFEFERI
jgi:hypothetical protein